MDFEGIHIAERRLHKPYCKFSKNLSDSWWISRRDDQLQQQHAHKQNDLKRKMPAKFFCKRTFPIPHSQVFIFAGKILDGTVSRGMKIQIPGLSISKEIQFVEVVHTDDSDAKVGLAILVNNQEESNFLKTLNISNEELEIE